MTLRLRILALLSLLSLVFLGTFLFLESIQQNENSLAQQKRQADLAQRLQRLVNTTSRSTYRYLRNYSARSGMLEFISSRDPAWAEKNLKGRMDTYRIDSVWVLKPDGAVVYGLNRPTDSVLTVPPIPTEELSALLRAKEHFSFYASLGDGLYQIQGMPILPATDLDRRGAADGWLLAAKRWGQPMLEDLADAGQGRVELTPAQHKANAAAPDELEAWLPLLDHRGQPIAGLDYRVANPLAEDPAQEHLEIVLFVLNSAGILLLLAVLLHYWILRPFSLMRRSLALGDPAPLAPLLGQRDEFGQMARLVQSSLIDRERLALNLEERTRLGRELHDGAIQSIYGAGMALSSAQSLMTRDLPAAQKLLHETRDELNRIILELRSHVERVDPQPLDSSFGEAVARLIQLLHGPGPVTTELDIDESLVADHAPLLRSHVLQFVREAVSNALRHGRPSRISVSWRRTAEGSALMVGDDGQGFDPETIRPGGRGLGNLSERAVALGGRLDIDSEPNRGTRVSLKLSCPKASS